MGFGPIIYFLKLMKKYFKLVILLLLTNSAFAQNWLTYHGDLDFCNNTGVQLTASIKNPKWYLNDQYLPKIKTQSIWVYKPGIYHFKDSLNNPSNTRIVKSIGHIPKPSIIIRGDSLISTLLPNYQWWYHINGRKYPPNFKSSHKGFKPQITGWYSVNSFNICEEVYSDSVYWEESPPLITVSSDIDVIAYSKYRQQIEIKIINSTGKAILTKLYTLDKGNVTLYNDISTLETGYYKLYLKINDIIKTYSLLKE
jgi:hypothetical protein